MAFCTHGPWVDSRLIHQQVAFTKNILFGFWKEEGKRRKKKIICGQAVASHCGEMVVTDILLPCMAERTFPRLWFWICQSMCLCVVYACVSVNCLCVFIRVSVYILFLFPPVRKRRWKSNTVLKISSPGSVLRKPPPNLKRRKRKNKCERPWPTHNTSTYTDGCHSHCYAHFSTFVRKVNNTAVTNKISKLTCHLRGKHRETGVIKNTLTAHLLQLLITVTKCDYKQSWEATN